MTPFTLPPFPMGGGAQNQTAQPQPAPSAPQAAPSQNINRDDWIAWLEYTSRAVADKAQMYRPNATSGFDPVAMRLFSDLTFAQNALASIIALIKQGTL